MIRTFLQVELTADSTVSTVRVLVLVWIHAETLDSYVCLLRGYTGSPNVRIKILVQVPYVCTYRQTVGKHLLSVQHTAYSVQVKPELNGQYVPTNIMSWCIDVQVLYCTYS